MPTISASAATASATSALQALLDEDPYLQYRPKFAYSLPVQVLLQGITLTLLAVLAIHLLFTTQYHWPLSKFNYFLQLGGIFMLLVTVISTLCLILTSKYVTAEQWPYMLDYIQVSIPNETWSQAAEGAWYFLQALCNFLVHLAHIQFLTLLYPSNLEVKLISIILGPLSLLASCLTFTALSDNRNVIDLGDAIRNVFNSTLLLIFCISLILWGSLVNRKRAWRLDGGTALFGIGSMSLAVASTAMNFVAVREDGLSWFQNLIWATILWQSWLGFWWWVGSGMGIGEVEDMVEREERKKLKEQKRRRRRQKQQQRLEGNGAGGSAREGSSSALSHFVDVWRSGSQTLTRRGRGSTSQGEDIEMHDLDATASPRLRRRQSNDVRSDGDERNGNGTARGSGGNRQGNGQGGTSSSSTVSGTPLESVSGILGYPINSVLRWIRYLRKKHEVATTEKVIERVARRQKAFEKRGDSPAGGRAPMPGLPGANLTARELSIIAAQDNPEGSGWGLGRRGVVQAQEGIKRVQEAQRLSRRERLLGGENDEDEGREEEEPADLSDVERGHGRLKEPVAESSTRRQTRAATARARETDRALADLEEEIRVEDENNPRAPAADDADWVDEEIIVPEAAGRRGRRSARRSRGREQRGRGDDSDDDEGGGWTWWGPLRKWRLSDRTTY